MQKKLNKISLCIVFLTIFSFTTPLFAFPNKTLEKEYLDLGYSHEFLTDPSTLATLGNFRFGAETYIENSNMGLGIIGNVGGFYTLNAIDKENSTKIKIPLDQFDFKISFSFLMGPSFHFPISNFLSFSLIPGINVDYLGVTNDYCAIVDFLFGTGASVFFRFFPESKVNFIAGSDLSFNFLQLGIAKAYSKSIDMDPFTQFFTIKPFIGIGIKFDYLHKNTNTNKKHSNRV